MADAAPDTRTVSGTIRFTWLDRLYLAWMNLRHAPRERQRWRNAADRSSLRPFYGYDTLAHDRTRSIGGMLKSIDLAQAIPNDADRPNLLYLVSSALPPHAPRMIAEARRAGAPVVLNQNGVGYPAWCGTAYRHLNKPLRVAHSQANYVIYQSAYCKTAAEHFLGSRSGPSEILHNPVDTRQFQPTPAVHPDEHLILLAGSHQAFYRVSLAIDTLACLRAQGRAVRLRIAGRCIWQPSDPAAREEIRRYAASHDLSNHIEITGPYTPDDAPPLLTAAGVLLHTKVNDDCPRLVVEAMACGLPVVYSATGGTPELVGDEGGLGVPGPLDWNHIRMPSPAALAAAVAHVLDHRAAFSAGARRRAVERFDIRPWISRHQAIFESMRTGQLHA